MSPTIYLFQLWQRSSKPSLCSHKCSLMRSSGLRILLQKRPKRANASLKKLWLSRQKNHIPPRRNLRCVSRWLYESESPALPSKLAEILEQPGSSHGPSSPSNFKQKPSRLFTGLFRGSLLGFLDLRVRLPWRSVELRGFSHG